MIPLIALDLSLDGIVVMSRAPEGPDHGKWWREGVVRLDADDMSEQLHHMRARCAARVGEDFTSILVIPDSQILFTSLERDDRDAKTTIRALLRGRTPYPVEDLTFDFVQRGDRLQVAVVARDTLQEAEAFAAGFGFQPVALIGNPADSPYPGIPDFGRTGIAGGLLAGAALTLDLGAGFTVIPAPAAPDLPDSGAEALEPALHPSAAPETSDATAENNPPPRAPLPAVSEPEPAIILPELTAPRVPPAPPLPPKTVVPPGTPIASQAGRSPIEAAAPAPDTPEIAPDFASAMAKTPDAIPPEGEGPAEDAVTASGAEMASGAFVRGAATPAPTPADAPTFSTRRRAPGPDSPRGESGPTRIAPRLFQPAVDDGTSESGAAPQTAQTPGKLSPVAPAGESSAPPVAEPSADRASTTEEAAPRPASFRAAALSALAGKTGRAAPGADRTPKAARSLRPGRWRKTPSAGTEETPALSGTARAAPIAPREGSTGGRRGLYLTLSLLAVLVALAIWSVAFRSDDVAGLAASGDAPTAVDPPPSTATPGEGTAIVDLASPGGTADLPQPDPTDDDLALLLPDSQGSPAASNPATGSGDFTVDAADEPAGAGVIGGDADPATELRASGPTAADVGPGIAVVTTDAEPFELPRDIAEAPATGSADEIYLASIDPVIEGTDAVALPRAAPPADAFSPQTSPAPAGTAFDTGSDGLVVASAAGTLAPGGYSVIAGRPATLPNPRPGATAAQQATQGAVDDAARTNLGRIRPAQRPEDAPERAERLTFNGLTREELTRTRPVRRPAAVSEAVARAEAAATRQAASVQAAASAAVASLAQTDPSAGVPEPDAVAAVSSSRYALAESRRPGERPRSVEQDAARIVTQRRAQSASAAASTSAGSTAAAESTGSTSLPAAADSNQQTIRSAGGSVSRAATQSNQIRLRQMNLIGVYGRPNSRRALVRLSNGRYVKVEVGDRLERGRVTAIGESEVIYQQNGRNYALRMPQT